VDNLKQKMQKQVSVSLILSDFDSSFLAPEWVESQPELRIWLDRNFIRKPVSLKLNDHDKSQSYKVELQGSYEGANITNTAAIGFQMFVRTRSEQGLMCTVDAGTDKIDIQDLLAHSEKMSGEVYEKELTFTVKSASNAVKGKIKAKLETMNLSGASLVANPLIGDVVDKKKISSELLAYIESTVKTGKSRFKERASILSRIRVPAYLGEAGLEMTDGVPLPSAAFVMYEIPDSSLPFWQNAFKVALDRHNISLRMFTRLSDPDKARCMLSTVTYVAQSLPYIGDHLNRNSRVGRYMKNLETSIENFGQALVTWSGDCEDLAQAIMVVHEALMKADLSEGYPELQEIQQLGNQYVSFMCLDSVTSAAVGGQGKGFGAHMNVFFLPQGYVKDCISRDNNGPVDRLPFDERYMRRDLPVLTAEGTGLFESTEIGDEFADYRRQVYTMPALASFKKPIVHKYGTDSRFYDSALVGFTRHFYKQGSDRIAFWFSTPNSVRGVKFRNLEANSNDVVLVAQPALPDRVKAVCEESVKIRVPPNELTLTGDKSKVSVPKHLEWVRNEIKALGRNPTASDLPVVSVQNPIDSFTEKDASDILRDVKSRTTIYDMDYHFERVVDGVPDNLRLQFYCDPNLSSW